MGQKMIRGNDDRQSMRRQRRVLAAAALLAGSYNAVAGATQYTWLYSVSGNNWTTAANWSTAAGNVAPPTAPALGDTTDLVFPGSLAANNTSTQNTGPIIVNSMSFSFVPTGTATLSISGSST